MSKSDDLFFPQHACSEFRACGVAQAPPWLASTERATFRSLVGALPVGSTAIMKFRSS